MNSGHVILKIEEGSPAAAHGMKPGDVLLSVNGKAVKDVFDYRYLTQEKTLAVHIRRQDGTEKTLRITKEEEEDPGLVFAHGLMDQPKRCANQCVFCFIDQLPPNMRETLYFKDDDARLSFLSGNYVTLTNMSQDELDRIMYYHLSPINISVHATEPSLRARLLGNPKAAGLLPLIEKLHGARVALNFQVVLCKNINDGVHLDRTISDLSRFMPRAESLSVVPAGLTRHRGGLPALENFSREDAAAVLDQVEGWQTRFQAEGKSRFVFAADEFYLKAGRPCPAYTAYEDFPQLENGVGMLSLFSRQFDQSLRKAKQRPAPKGCLSLVTGRAAAELLSALSLKMVQTFPGARLDVHVIDNVFFGENITVSGLLTGQDILTALTGKSLGRRLLIPANALRENTFLDDVTVRDLAENLALEVKPVKINGGALLKEIFI